MRRRTRNVILGTFAVLFLLVAFVAVLSSVGSGDPYYVTASAVDDVGAGDGSGADGDGTGGESPAAVNGTALPERRFPYVSAAIENAARSADGTGRSGGYRTGFVGIKEVFSHSPFDELDALRQQNPNATVGEDIRIRRSNATYRVGIVREGT